jgi:DNA-binding CsgD family transcriptional regulator
LVDFVLLAAAEEGDRPFPEHVVESLRRVVPCDTVAYREWNDEEILDRSFASDGREDRWTAWQAYPRFRRDDPHPSEVTGPSTGSSRVEAGRPLVLSEAVSRRWFRDTALYYELMRPFGIRDVLKLFLARNPHDRSQCVFVFDTSARGFTDADRAVLTRLAPVLAQLRRNARFRSWARRARRPLGLLTPRELVVLGHAAAGRTNHEIAAALFIGESTVRKHLEHVYEKLEVRNRAAATAVYTRASGPPADW